MDDGTCKNNFICAVCEKHFSRRFSLKRHLKVVHSQEQNTLKEGEILKEFIDFSEFSAWKEQQETKTNSMFIRRRGTATRKNGDKMLHYYCSRSGVFKPRGSGLKSLKSQGSAKIGTICPARMVVKITTDKVTVNFFPKHENHEMELKHLRLSQSKREAVAGINIIRGHMCTHTPAIAQISYNPIKDRDRENEMEMAESFETQDDLLKKTLDILPTVSGSEHSSNVSSSVRTKLESILSVLDECRFSTQENDMIHKNLNKVLDICRNNIKKETEFNELSNMNVRKKIEKPCGYFFTKRKCSLMSRSSNPADKESVNIKKIFLSKDEVFIVKG